jgi:hypothetical protein
MSDDTAPLCAMSACECEIKLSTPPTCALSRRICVESMDCSWLPKNGSPIDIAWLMLLRRRLAALQRCSLAMFACSSCTNPRMMK